MTNDLILLYCYSILAFNTIVALIISFTYGISNCIQVFDPFQQIPVTPDQNLITPRLAAKKEIMVCNSN